MNEADRDSGEFPVFDGSEDDPSTTTTMNLHELFFDMQGQAITPAAFKRQFPKGRVLLRRDYALGLEVSTEFSGINHNTDPDGAPWLFETIVLVDAAIVYSHWNESESAARMAHTLAIWKVWAGGAIRWRGAMVARRVRHKVRSVFGATS